MGTGPSGVSHGVLGHPEETGASPLGRDSCGRGGGSLLREGGHGCQGGAGGRGVPRVPSADYGLGHQGARSSRLCPPAGRTENRGQGYAGNAAGDCPVLRRCSINAHCRDAGGESPCWVHLLTHLVPGVRCQPPARSVPCVDSPANTGLRVEASRGAACVDRPANTGLRESGSQPRGCVRGQPCKQRSERKPAAGLRAPTGDRCPDSGSWLPGPGAAWGQGCF